MFFILSKILDFLVSPFTYVITLLIWALLTKSQLRRKKLVVWCLGLTFFFGNDFIASELIRWWELPQAKLENKSFDIGIVLGGMASYDASNDIIKFNSSTDRLLQALPKHYNGKIETLFFSGGSGDIYHPENLEADLITRYLKEIGFPMDNYLFENKSKNTYQNALYSKEKLEEVFGDLSTKKILIITSAMHMRRTIGCFEKQGIKAEYLNTNKWAGPRKFEFEHCFIPGIVGFSKWKHLGHEILGYITYSITGRI